MGLANEIREIASMAETGRRQSLELRASLLRKGAKDQEVLKGMVDLAAKFALIKKKVE